MNGDPADQAACTAAVLEITPEAVVVSNLGVASYVLAEVSGSERDRNFYQWGSMGVTTPVGLGLAVAVDDPVTVLEGDGSLLMSLGVLATVGRLDPPNLTIVLMNNGRYGTTGGQPTHAAGTDFVSVANGCGVDARAVRSAAGFREAYRAARGSDGATLIDAKVAPADPETRPPFDYPAIARRVRRAVVDDRR